MHDASAVSPRRIVVCVDHAPYPLNLAGEIAIMGAVVGAGRNHFRTVAGIRADGREHDASARCEFPHRFRIERVGDDERQRRRRGSQ